MVQEKEIQQKQQQNRSIIKVRRIVNTIIGFVFVVIFVIIPYLFFYYVMQMSEFGAFTMMCFIASFGFGQIEMEREEKEIERIEEAVRITTNIFVGEKQRLLEKIKTFKEKW